MKSSRFPIVKAMSGFVLFFLAGCAGYVDLPAGTVKQVECRLSSPVVEKQEVSVPQVKLETPPSYDYVIGLNDVLYININGRPEFLVTGTSTNTKIQGSRVDGSGNIQLPIVGAVHVEGLTLAQAQTLIQEKLHKYLKEPWVVVEVAEYRSHPVYLLGQFKTPGTFYMDRPLTLTQGIALGNGFDSPLSHISP